MLRVVVRTIDTINERLGKGVSWLIVFLMLITVYDVFMRYVFRTGTVAFMESETYLYMLNFMLAAGWTLLVDGHVRVDLAYGRLGPKKKAWVDFFGSLVFCIPFCVLVIWMAWPFVLQSWQLRECSPDPGGLPCTYLIKTALPVTFILVALQAISQMIKNLLVIVGKEEEL